MKPFRSLRLRITLLCALLLTLCCAAWPLPAICLPSI